MRRTTAHDLRRRLRPWLLPAVLVFVAGMPAWTDPTSVVTATTSQHAVQLLVLAALIGFSTRWISWSVLIALGALAAITLVQVAGDAHRWQRTTPTGPAPVLAPAVASITGSEHDVTAWRTWSAQGTAGRSTVLLHLRLRRGAGTPGWDWYHPSGSPLAVRPDPAMDGVAHVEPSGPSDFVYRSADLDRPLAGTRLRGAVDIRHAGSGRACGRVSLSQDGGGMGLAQEVCAEAEWRRVFLTWEPPATAEGSRVNLVLHSFPADAHLLLRAPEIHAFQDGAWQPVEPLGPAGVRVAAWWSADPDTRKPIVPVRDVQLTPGPTWTDVEWMLDAPPPNARTLVLQLGIEEGVTLETASVRATVLEGPGRLFPQRGGSRYAGVLAHPNIAGHTAAALGLSALASTPVPWHLAPLAFLAGGLVVASGSRIAFAVLVVGVLGLLYLRRRFWPRIATYAAVVAVVGFGIVALLGLAGVRELGTTPATARADVWSAAWDALRDHPWRGLRGAGQTFAEYWAATRPGGELVTHAHNLWLDFGAQYGVVGVVAALLLGLSVVATPLHRRDGAAVAAVVGILALNLFDVTLFSVGVLAALVIVGRDAAHSRPSG